MKRSSQRFQLANSVEFDGRNLVKQISLSVIQATSVAVMLSVQFFECVLVVLRPTRVTHSAPWHLFQKLSYSALLFSRC